MRSAAKFESTQVASSEQNADLFWALRGGCGNFGVVVEFVFAPKPFRQMVPSLQRVHLPIPFLCPSREELVKHWRDNVESAPRDVYPLMVMTPMPTIELFHGVGDGATLESLAAYENFGRPVVSERKERDFFSKILCGNQPVRRVLGDDAAVLARSSGEESTPPRHRTGVASTAWRTTRRSSTNAP